MESKLLKRTWAEIDLDRLIQNYRHIKKISLGRVMPIIKADAYGHGAEKVAVTLQGDGVDFFAVSNIEEALSLRRSKISGDILILGYTPVSYVKELSENNIIQTIFEREYAHELSKKATESGVRVRVHVKIDTGMNRIGFKPYIDEVIDNYSLENIDVCGIFTHYSCADTDSDFGTSYSDTQWEKFSDIISRLKEKGIDPGCCHCNNSASILLHPDRSMDMVRPGIILYGCDPSNEVYDHENLKPVLQIKSVVSMVKRVKKGEHIGYGATQTTDRDSNIVTVPIGYADGYPRSLSNGVGEVIIRNKKYPIIGHICMDQMMINMGEDMAEVDDIVTVLGESENCSISAEDLAAKCHTISYEILCNISRRVPRVYFRTGEEKEIVNYILKG